jgi:hypothetical protein
MALSMREIRNGKTSTLIFKLGILVALALSIGGRAEFSATEFDGA